MLKKIFYTFIFSLYACVLIANDSATKKPPMRLLMPIIRAENFDFIERVPQNTSVIFTVVNAYKNERLVIVPQALAIVENNGDTFELEYKISISSTGKPTKVVAKDVYKNKIINKEFLTPLPFSLELVFENSDSFGPYEILLEAKNLTTGESAKTTTVLNLIEWTTPSQITDKKEFNKIFKNYNLRNNPQELYALFVSPHSSFKDKKNNFALTSFAFFKNAFLNHKFLLDLIAKEFPSYPQELRSKTIELFEMVGEGYKLNSLNDSEKKLQKSMWDILSVISKPSDVPHSPVELDVLWGEFFAKGNYTTIEKILNSIDAHSANTLEFFKDNSALKTWNRKKQISSIVGFAGCWSMLSNCSANELAKKYLFFALNNFPKEKNQRINAVLKATSEYIKQQNSAKKIKEPTKNQ